MVEQSNQGQAKLVVETESLSEGVVVVLCPRGRIDGSTTEILDASVREQMEGGAKVLIFDFEGTNYISSAGLRVLLVSARGMQSSSGRAIFCGLMDHIAQVFEISGFSDILDIRANRAEALASV